MTQPPRAPRLAAYEWDCPNCGERISTLEVLPTIRRPEAEAATLDVERLARALLRLNPLHAQGQVYRDWAAFLAAEYARLAAEQERGQE